MMRKRKEDEPFGQPEEGYQEDVQPDNLEIYEQILDELYELENTNGVAELYEFVESHTEKLLFSLKMKEYIFSVVTSLFMALIVTGPIFLLTQEAELSEMIEALLNVIGSGLAIAFFVRLLLNAYRYLLVDPELVQDYLKIYSKLSLEYRKNLLVAQAISKEIQARPRKKKRRLEQ